MTPEMSLDGLLQFAANFGLSGIVLMIWWVGQRDTQKILTRYRDDMVEQREMYKSNAELVKRYINLCDDQKELVAMNVQAMTRLVNSIEDNKFCPMVRLEKKARGVQE